jgi:plasmid replication initiation protein
MRVLVYVKTGIGVLNAGVDHRPHLCYIKIMENSIKTQFNKDLLVKKSNKIINYKISEMTAIEKKIILILISQIKVDDEKLERYKIPLSGIIKSGGSSRKIYSQAVDIAKNIITRSVFIPSIDRKGKETFEVFQWLSYIKYEDGCFLARVNEDMKPFLLNLKEKFTRYNLDYALKMKSFYSIRIYEILSQFKNTGWRQMKVKELRNLLDIEEKHSRYNDFKRYVLERSIKEINKLTDLNIDYEEIKTSRRVTSIKFLIESKIDLKIPLKIKSEPKRKYNNNFKNPFIQDTHKMTTSNTGIEKTTEEIKIFRESEIAIEQEKETLDLRYNEIPKAKRTQLKEEATEILSKRYNFFSEEQVKFEVLELNKKSSEEDQHQETLF